MSQAAPHPIRFGVFELDPRTGDLRKSGLRVKLRGRPLDLLLLLVARPGELVTREELRDRLWPADTFVDFDHGLNVAVNRLREALGDASDNPRFVETLPRKGYRFIAPVTTAIPTAADPASGAEQATAPDGAPVGTPTPPAPDQASSDARRGRRSAFLAGALAVAVAVVAGVVLLRPRLPGPAAAVARPLRVAVLPFRDLGGDAEHAWFAAGMTEALTAELAQVSALRVISRASVSAVAEAAARPLAEIARQLDVGALVDGSVLRSGDRVRITAQLVDVAGDRTLWARNYDCDLQDVIDVQRRVAREIADEVRVTVTPREGERLARSSPVNPQAYEAYLIGRFHRERLTGDDLNVAREQFQRAIELDPGYAPAHAALADCYWIMGTAGFELRPQGETAPLARGAAERALALDPELGSAEATLAMVEAYHDWNWDEAEVRLRRVIAANPSFSKAHVWYSGLLAATGRFDEAIVEARRGLDLDPLAATARQTLGWRYFYAGNFAHAEQEFRRTLVAEPGSFVARLGLGQTLLESGAGDPLPELEQALRDAGDSPYALAALGNASARRGQGDRTRKALDELATLARRRYVSPVYAAFVQVALGDTAAALDGLEAAFAERSGWMVYLPVQPELRPLRDEPRFRSLLLKVGHRPGPRRRPWTGGR